MSGWKEVASLPEGRAVAAATACNGYLFVIGGSTSPAPPFAIGALPIISSRIESDGSLGNWSTVSALEASKIGVAAASSGDFIYIVGGPNQETPVNSIVLGIGREIRSARVEPGGTLKPTAAPNDADFEQESSLSYALAIASIAKSGNYLYGMSGFRIGGQVGFKNQTVDFQVGELVTGGTSGATMVIEALTDAGATGVLLSEHLNQYYFLDGETLTGNLGGAAEADGDATVSAAPNSYLSRAAIIPGGDVGAWLPVAPVPDTYSSPNRSLAIYNDTFFFVTGSALVWGRLQEVATGGWKSIRTPEDCIFTTAVIVDDTLLVVGGMVSGVVSTVYCVKVSGDGPVGPWYKTEDLPAAIAGHALVAVGNRLYVLGGSNLSAVTPKVYTALVDGGCIAGVKIPVNSP